MATKISSLSTGTIVKLREDGVLKDFYVVEHNYNLYGYTLFMRKEHVHAFHSAKKYESAQGGVGEFNQTHWVISDFFNNGYFNLLDTSFSQYIPLITKGIVTFPFPIGDTGSNRTGCPHSMSNNAWHASSVQTKCFALSTWEMYSDKTPFYNSNYTMSGNFGDQYNISEYFLPFFNDPSRRMTTSTQTPDPTDGKYDWYKTVTKGYMTWDIRPYEHGCYAWHSENDDCYYARMMPPCNMVLCDSGAISTEKLFGAPNNADDRTLSFASCLNYRPCFVLPSNLRIDISTGEVSQSHSPNKPGSFSKSTIKPNARFSVSFGAGSDADGDLDHYTVERQRNSSGKWEEIYKGPNTSISDIASVGDTTLQYRARSVDSEGMASPYSVSSVFEVPAANSNTPLGDLLIGSIVKVTETGAVKDHTVIHQGNPNTSIYDSSCSGTWLMRSTIAGDVNGNYGASGGGYHDSVINTKLQAVLARYTAEAQACMKSAKIPYTNGSSVISGGSGFSTKIFALSAVEMGMFDNSAGSIPSDGALLSYFLQGTGSAADAKRVAYYEISIPANNPATYWTRTCNTGTTYAYGASTSGAVSKLTRSSNREIRQAFILPQNLLVDPSGNIIFNQAPTAPGVPVVPSGTLNSNINFNIQWTASTDPDGNLDRYVLQRNLNGSGEWNTVYEGSNLLYTDILSVGTTSVQYRVSAVDTMGFASANSVSATKSISNSVTKLKDIVNGTQVSITPTSSGFVNIYRVIHPNWTAAESIQYYGVDLTGYTLLFENTTSADVAFGGKDTEYPDSLALAKLINDFTASVPSKFRNLFLPIRVPYLNNSLILQTGNNAAPAKPMFIPSYYELNFPTQSSVPRDGKSISYFTTDATRKVGIGDVYYTRTSKYANPSGSFRYFFSVGLSGSYQDVVHNNTIGCAVRGMGFVPSALLVGADGFIISNEAPTKPGTISYPNPLKGGKENGISWAASTDPDGNLAGYRLYRAINGGASYTKVYDGPRNIFTDTVPYGTISVVYKVEAYDTVDFVSAPEISPSIPVKNNTPPSTPGNLILGGDKSWNQSWPISWTESSDPDGNLVGYIVQYRTHTPNGVWGSYIELYRGLNLNTAFTPLRENDSVTIRVCAYDSEGDQSDWASINTGVLRNHTPKITLSDFHSDDTSVTMFYTATDADADVCKVTLKLDDKIIWDNVPIVLNQKTQFSFSGHDFMQLANGSHKFLFAITDVPDIENITPLSSTAEYDFSKNITKISIVKTIPLEADAMVTKAVLQVNRMIPPGALLKIEVCNNGNDAVPTWEDVTSAVLSGRNFLVTNTTKTAEQWGFNVRVTVDRNGAVGDCYISGIGGNFE